MSNGYIKSGYATNFADPTDLAKYRAAIAAGHSVRYALRVGDNGVGSPYLGSVSTPSSYGIAVPTSYLRKNFGADPADWRTARAEITMNGQTVQVPFIDVGPGTGPQKRGVIADLSYPLSQGLGGTGKDPVQIRPLADAGADYTSDRAAWDAEQAAIAAQMRPGTSLAESGAPTPMTPAMTDVELAKEMEAARTEQALQAAQDILDTG